jgi:hypothetical protein
MTADGALRISTDMVAPVLLLVAVYYGTDVLRPTTNWPARLDVAMVEMISGCWVRGTRRTG